jgi:hypothetical protein
MSYVSQYFGPVAFLLWLPPPPPPLVLLLLPTIIIMMMMIIIIIHKSMIYGSHHYIFPAHLSPMSSTAHSSNTASLDVSF